MKKHLLNGAKHLILAIGFGLIGFTATAQTTQVGNSGFENWDNLGTDDEEPANWNSFMTANCTMSSFVCGMGQKQQVEQSADAHSGSYSAKITSRSVLGIVANGNLTLGRIHMGSSTATDPSNYNYTDTQDPDFNQPFTGKPDSLVVWVKYENSATTDSARISATIHDNYNYRDPEDANATPHVVAHAIKNYASNGGTWQRISIPFAYTGPATNAQYILITFTTNKTPGGGTDSDVVYIDDLEMIYNSAPPTSTPYDTITPIATQNLQVNEAGNVLTVADSNGTAVSHQWVVTQTSGSGYTAISGETGTTYTPQFSTAGTYYVACAADFGGGVADTSNEVKIVVTNTAPTLTVSIAPTATQNLQVNEAGTTLTVTETPSAATREWKYSTTSGSGYQSFSPAETGTSYTPEFANTGTYYVVCMSTLSGNTVTSNEVKINVTDTSSAGISINQLANVKVFGNSNGLNIDLTKSEMNHSSIQLYSITGRIVASSSLKDNTLNTINLDLTEGIYFYTIQDGNRIAQGKVYIP